MSEVPFMKKELSPEQRGVLLENSRAMEQMGINEVWRHLANITFVAANLHPPSIKTMDNIKKAMDAPSVFIVHVEDILPEDVEDDREETEELTGTRISIAKFDLEGGFALPDSDIRLPIQGFEDENEACEEMEIPELDIDDSSLQVLKSGLLVLEAKQMEAGIDADSFFWFSKSNW